MKERNNWLRVVFRLANLVLGLLIQAFVLGQAGPDILWSRNGHTDAVNSVTFSQDGSLVASGSSDGTARIWQAANGSPVVTLTNQANGVLQVAFTSNGSLASWDTANALKVWEVSSGFVLKEKGIPGIGWRTAFAPNGELFAVAGATTMYIWDVANGTLVKTFVPDQDASPSFSPDGQMVAAGLHIVEEYRIYLWHLSDGDLGRTLSNSTEQCCLSLGVPPVFSQDSGILAAITFPYHITEFWRLNDGALYGSLYDLPSQYNKGNVYTKLLAFTPDNRLIVTVNSFDSLLFWRFKPGRTESPLLRYDQETAGTKTLGISLKGDLFAYGREDGKVIVARVPVFITETRLSNGKFVLQWAGGSGLYQVQQRSNLASGTWENVGMQTANTGVTNNVSGASLFYRVQSLSN